MVKIVNQVQQFDLRKELEVLYPFSVMQEFVELLRKLSRRPI